MLIKGIRSFSPDNQNVIEFYRPLTLIVGHNGAGKTVRAAAGAWSGATAGGGDQRATTRCCFPGASRRGSAELHSRLPPVPSLFADRDRVPEDGLHRGAATQHPLRPELYSRPKGAATRLPASQAAVHPRQRLPALSAPASACQQLCPGV